MKGNAGQNFIANLRTELQPKAGHWEGNHLRQKAWPVSTVRVWEELRAQEREGSTATYDTRLRLPRATTQLPQNHRTSTNTGALFPLRLPCVHRWHQPHPDVLLTDLHVVLTPLWSHPASRPIAGPASSVSKLTWTWPAPWHTHCA